MLGWHFNVYVKPEELVWEDRILESGEVWARVPELDREHRLYMWDAGLGGTKWIDELVDAEKASLLALNGGYPIVYETTVRELLRVLPTPSSLRGKVHRVGGDMSKLDSTTPIILEVWDQS